MGREEAREHASRRLCQVEHEVIDDELTTTLEAILEAPLAVRLYHGNAAPLGVHAVGKWAPSCRRRVGRPEGLHDA
jgi:hypothetical protein